MFIFINPSRKMDNIFSDCPYEEVFYNIIRQFLRLPINLYTIYAFKFFPQWLRESITLIKMKENNNYVDWLIVSDGWVGIGRWRFLGMRKRWRCRVFCGKWHMQHGRNDKWWVKGN